jgi:hypothetical protein
MSTSPCDDGDAGAAGSTGAEVLPQRGRPALSIRSPAGYEDVSPRRSLQPELRAANTSDTTVTEMCLVDYIFEFKSC